MQVTSLKVGFIGTGRMATALAAGFTRELLATVQIYGVDPFAQSRQQFQAVVGKDVRLAETADECLSNVDVLFLAVKPQTMQAALEAIRSTLRDDTLVVSIAAGLTVTTLESWLPETARLIRVMPNTPCLIGQGASGVTRGSRATEADERIVSELLETVGLVERVPEKLMDAVTGLSGSGPAYVFQMIEALSDGGVMAGLPRDTATRLAAQTLLGAAKMVLETGQHPGALKDAVTSPGGTTIAGIYEMEQAGVRAALMNAVTASAARSRQLAGE